MPGNYDGRPGQITFPTALTVVGCIAGNPTSVVVSGSLPAEFFLTGYGGVSAAPQVTVQGIQGIPGANGTFIATPTGASVFTIPVNTTGQGPYVSGGTVAPLYVQSLYTLPVDGDSDNSASIASWGQATGDRTQSLAGMAGFAKNAGLCVLRNPFTGTGGVAWATTGVSGVASGTWIPMTTSVSLTPLSAATGGISVAGINLAPHPVMWGFAGFQQGPDIARVSLEANVLQMQGNVYLGLFYQYQAYGAAAPTSLASMTLAADSVRYGVPGSVSGPFLPIRSSAWLSQLGSGVLWIAPAIGNFTGSPVTINTELSDSAIVEVECRRITGMLE